MKRAWQNCTGRAGKLSRNGQKCALQGALTHRVKTAGCSGCNSTDPTQSVPCQTQQAYQDQDATLIRPAIRSVLVKLVALLRVLVLTDEVAISVQIFVLFRRHPPWPTLREAPCHTLLRPTRAVSASSAANFCHG